MAIFALLLLLAIGALMWRLSAGPIDLSLLRETMTEALSQPERDLYVRMDEIALEWQGADSGFLIALGTVEIGGAHPEETLLSIKEIAVSLSLPHLLIGRIKPKALIFKDPALVLMREETGRFYLGFDSVRVREKPGATDPESPDLMDILKIWVQEDQTAPSPFALLEGIEIDSAHLTLTDKLSGLGMIFPKVDLTIGRHAGSLVVMADAFLAQENTSPAYLRTKALYTPESGMLTLDGIGQNVTFSSIEGLGAGVLGQQDVQADISFDVKAQKTTSLSLHTAHLSVNTRDGAFLIPELDDSPIAFDSLAATLSWEADSGEIALTNATLALPTVRLTAESRFSVHPPPPEEPENVEEEAQPPESAREPALHIPLTVTMESVSLPDLQAAFPEGLKDTEIYHWLGVKSTGGRFESITTTLDFLVSGDVPLPPSFTLPDSGESRTPARITLSEAVASFAFEDVAIDYNPPMIAATQVQGTGQFSWKDNSLHLTLPKAQLGTLAVEDATLAFKDVMTVGGGVADIHARVTGKLSGVLQYVAQDPIGFSFGENQTLTPEDVEGNADLTLHIQFPTILDMPKDAVNVTASGTLTDIHIPRLVEGLDLRGDHYDVTLSKNVLQVEGQGLLDSYDVDFVWTEHLSTQNVPFSTQIVAKLTADKRLWSHFGADLDSYLGGNVPTRLIYTDNGMQADARTATLDLSLDLGTARLAFTPLDYVKPAGTPAKGSFGLKFESGTLKRIEPFTLSAPTLDVSGGWFAFGAVNMKGQTQNDIRSAHLPRVRMNENDLSLTLERTQEGTMKIALKGAFLDASTHLQDIGKKPPSSQDEDTPFLISIDVAQMRTRPDHTLSDARLFLEIDTHGETAQIEMDARAGTGLIYLRYKPDSTTGKRRFRLEADDAGATLKAFGLYDRISGGKLVVHAAPIGTYLRTGDLAGTVRLTDFQVVGTPTLARMLSAMSLPGLLQLLDREGLSFTRMEANFDWLTRPQGSIIVFRDGRTSGNALGLTFDGVIDNATDLIDISGTIVPVSGLNQMLAGVPLVGDILTGGAGGALFAATYTLKGSAKDPVTTVNPLSVLAPGIIRRLLFE